MIYVLYWYDGTDRGRNITANARIATSDGVVVEATDAMAWAAEQRLTMAGLQAWLNGKPISMKLIGTQTSLLAYERARLLGTN
jgi:hypothetical protein